MNQGCGILWALPLVTEESAFFLSAFLVRRAASGVFLSTVNVIGCDMPFTVLSISLWQKCSTNYFGNHSLEIFSCKGQVSTVAFFTTFWLLMDSMTGSTLSTQSQAWYLCKTLCKSLAHVGVRTLLWEIAKTCNYCWLLPFASKKVHPDACIRNTQRSSRSRSGRLVSHCPFPIRL